MRGSGWPTPPPGRPGASSLILAGLLTLPTYLRLLGTGVGRATSRVDGAPPERVARRRKPREVLPVEQERRRRAGRTPGARGSDGRAPARPRRARRDRPTPTLGCPSATDAGRRRPRPGRSRGCRRAVRPRRGRSRRSWSATARSCCPRRCSRSRSSPRSPAGARWTSRPRLPSRRRSSSAPGRPGAVRSGFADRNAVLLGPAPAMRTAGVEWRSLAIDAVPSAPHRSRRRAAHPGGSRSVSRCARGLAGTLADSARRDAETDPRSTPRGRAPSGRSRARS